MEVGVVDQVLKEVNVVLPKMTNVVALKRQKTKVSWKTVVVDFAQLVVGEVQVFNVVEICKIFFCGDFFYLVS